MSTQKLRWVSLGEAAQAGGKSERQLQRWAAKDKSLVRRRERGHIVEYCLDDVLAAVGEAPEQEQVRQCRRRVAELERSLAEVEEALAASREQVRQRRKAFDGVREKQKALIAEKDGKITALQVSNAALQMENNRLREAQGSGSSTVAGSLSQPVQRDWSVPVAKRPQTPPWQTPASPEPSLQTQLTETQQKLHECQHIIHRWKEHATQLETTLHQVRAESQNRVEHNAFLSQMLEDLGDIAFKSFDRSRWASRDDLKAQFQELFARVSPVLQRARKERGE